MLYALVTIFLIPCIFHFGYSLVLSPLDTYAFFIHAGLSCIFLFHFSFSPHLFTTFQFRGLTFGYQKTNGSAVLKSCLEYAISRHTNFLPGEAGFLLKLLQEVCFNFLCVLCYVFFLFQPFFSSFGDYELVWSTFLFLSCAICVSMYKCVHANILFICIHFCTFCTR